VPHAIMSLARNATVAIVAGSCCRKELSGGHSHSLRVRAYVDATDWLAFPACMSGPWGVLDWVMPSQECRDVFDLDADADVDLADFADFQNLSLPFIPSSLRPKDLRTSPVAARSAMILPHRTRIEGTW
jgi:hypothetical protein